VPPKYGSRLTAILIFDIAHVLQRELLHSKRLWEVTGHQQHPKNCKKYLQVSRYGTKFILK
jgi:hypothetical protein